MDGSVEKDASRPSYSRPSGECGIYVDFSDITPLDRHKYGSPQFMIADMMDKLYDELQKVPLDAIKYAFESKHFLDGVIIENWHKGCILSVGFNSQEAASQMWKDYENLKLEPVLTKYLLTPQLLQNMGAKKMTLRARIWQDEIDAAKMELERILIRPFTLETRENDIAMMKQVYHYQKNEFYNTIETLRGEYDHMDANLSTVTTLLRQALPTKVLSLTTFAQLHEYAERLLKRNLPFKKPYEDYLFMRQRIEEVTTVAQRQLVAPLLQVHTVVETEHQRELKEQMRQECFHNHHRLKEDYDWSHLKHPEYLKKIIHREHPFFLGMASVIGAGMDTLLEMDQQLDEYWSGVDGHIKLF